MAKAKTKSSGELKGYRVLAHITHNEEIYEPGKGTDTVIELDDAEAAPLLADKVIEPLKADKGDAK